MAAPGQATPCPTCERRIGHSRWGKLAAHCGLDGFRCPGSGTLVVCPTQENQAPTTDCPSGRRLEGGPDDGPTAAAKLSEYVSP
jgi:hypothetical protein